MIRMTLNIADSAGLSVHGATGKRLVITPEDVKHGKPAPDMFLLAAERMGLPPEQCLVFEDAEPGMRAAEAAGMQWVRVPSRVPKAKAAAGA